MKIDQRKAYRDENLMVTPQELLAYRVVPYEPISEMVRAACAITCKECHGDCEKGPYARQYKAMLDAAPKTSITAFVHPGDQEIIQLARGMNRVDEDGKVVFPDTNGLLDFVRELLTGEPHVNGYPWMSGLPNAPAGDKAA